MNIDIRDILTLSNNKKYIVVSKVNYDNNIYYFLTEKDNVTSIKFLM